MAAQVAAASATQHVGLSYGTQRANVIGTSAEIVPNDAVSGHCTICWHLVCGPSPGLQLSRLVGGWVTIRAPFRNAETGECLRTLEGHEHLVNSAVFSPDGLVVLTASYHGTAKFWNVETGECLLTLEGSANASGS